jgi:hypothetical protein
MPLTKITGDVIEDNVSIGLATATSLTVSGIVSATNVNVSGITTLTTLNVTGVSTLTRLNVTGVSTFTTGPVLIGSGTSTGTASQPLQVTGGAYVSGSLGIGTTNPVTLLQVGAATSQSVFITSTGLVGLGSTNPAVSLDASRETDAFALPQGTTAQRPTGNNPYIRWNTTNSALEVYNGTDWVEIITDYFPTGSVILG